jgi:enoyl-CoA hydratase
MKRGKSLDLLSALKLEFRLASHLIETHDYREGIAARIAGQDVRRTGNRRA